MTKTESNAQRRAAGYIRVSTEEQRKNGWNLGADRDRIERTITDQGWDRHDIYDDGGKQGDDPDRPEFLRMLSEADQFDVLIIRDLDRFSRKLAIYASAVDDLIAAGVTLYEFAGDGTGIKLLDLTDEDDRALADIKAVFAQLEKAKVKRRVKQAKAARAKAGLHPGGRRPFGYEFVDTERRGQHDKPIRELRPHPTEPAVVVRMFEMADAGTSQRKIAQILNADGITTSRGGLWHPSPVARVLGSPLYIGKIRRKVAGRWEVYDGEHKAILDTKELRALWERVNRTRATPQRRAGGRPLNSAHLLSRGQLRCGSCGSAMIPFAQTGRTDVYRCLGRHQHGPDYCAQMPVRRDLIDDALLRELTSRYLDVDGARDRLREHQAAELPLARAALSEAERELLKVNADARLSKITRGWQEDILSDDEYRTQRADVEGEVTAVRAAVAQARHRVDAIMASETTTDAEEALLRHLADLRALVCGTVDQARDVEGLRTVIRQLFASVELCAPENPFGRGAEGDLIPGEADVMIGSYRLVLRMRPEMVDLQAYEPVKAAVPGIPVPSTCRRT